jgi:membrane associated rhomboid family serine protease
MTLFIHVTQGASGAVNAVMLLQIFLNPKGLIYLYFVLPVPAALVVRTFSFSFIKFQ